jgi:NADH dehydrogenase [ubiquinone] 1 alpha subcomplex assembly factor 1
MTLPGPHLDASDSAPLDSKGALTLTNFTADSPDLGWYVQNDNVMGGRSEGGLETKDLSELLFSGSTNTNGGGFSSIRTQPFKFDASNYAGIQLHLKADGRRYSWQLHTTARYRGNLVSYWSDFDTPDGEWTTINIPFSSFYPQFRGMKLDGPELDPSEITEFGLYIYDKKDGPFEMHLDSVQAYSADAPQLSE